MQSILRFRGIETGIVSPKNWKDHSSKMLIFPKASPTLATELSDWSIEPLLFGSFDETEKEQYLIARVSLLWEEPSDQLFHLPISMMPPTGNTWCVCTGIPTFDKRIGLVLKSFGETVFIEGQLDHLIARIRTTNVEIVIFDWDMSHLDIQKAIALFKGIQKEKQILFIGIKNFEKDNLYRDLAYGISEISPSLFTISEILEIITNSLPLMQKKSKTKEKIDVIRKLDFEFQERRRPVRYALTEENSIANINEDAIILYSDLRSVFRWLFKRSF